MFFQTPPNTPEKYLEIRNAVPPCEQRGNVVVIIADDVGYEDLVPLMPFCPNLQRIADAGVTYTQAIANPLCSPTRRSLNTGLWSLADGGVTCSSMPTNPPPRSLVWLPELSGDCVDSTLVGKYHLGNSTVGPWQLAPQDQGGYGSWRAGVPMNLTNCGGSGYTFWRRVDDGIDFLTGEYEPYALRDTFTLWWDGPHDGRPRLAVYAASLPHAPFHQPPPDLLPAGWMNKPTQRGMFEAMIVALDATIGPIVDRLDFSRDLVIWVGDNGTPAPVAPDPNRAKGTVYERGIRVPMFVAGPGFPAGAVNQDLVHVVDIHATVGLFHATLPTADGLPLQVPGGHDIVLCGTVTGTPQMCARSAGFKLLRTAMGEQLFVLPDETTSHLGDPAYAVEEAALRAAMDPLEKE